MAIINLRFLPHLFMDNKSSIVLVLLIIIVMFLIGKIISFMNVNIMNTGYWEIRLIMIIFIFTSILSSISLIKLIDNLSLSKKKILPSLFYSFVISIIVLIGFSSLVLQSDFWFIVTSNFKISQKEWQTINFLRTILQNDKHAFTIAPSKDLLNYLSLLLPPL